MKLTAKTVQLLKNFSNINPSILIKEGSILTTMSPTKTIMAKAKVPDEFPVTFAVYNLSRFISTLSLFESPDLIFSSSSVKISGDKRSVVYHYAEPATIIVPPEKELKLPPAQVECVVTNKDLVAVNKAIGILGLSKIAIVGDGEKIYLQAFDEKSNSNASSDVYDIVIGETDKTFRAIFRPENIKIIDGDYKVLLTRGVSQFISTECTYWIVIEASSSF